MSGAMDPWLTLLVVILAVAVGLALTWWSWQDGYGQGYLNGWQSSRIDAERQHTRHRHE